MKKKAWITYISYACSSSANGNSKYFGDLNQISKIKGQEHNSVTEIPLVKSN
jgi:hypothetical protein